MPQPFSPYDEPEFAASYLQSRSRIDDGNKVEALLVTGVLKPHILPGQSTVLDLACGNGFFLQQLLDWGAGRVVGVDLSQRMLDAAQDAVGSRYGDRVTLIQADCLKPQSFPGAPFDAVLAAWLLTWCPDAQSLTDTLRNVSLNLKPGGTFVAVLFPTGAEPVQLFEEVVAKMQPPDSDKKWLELMSETEDGICVRWHLPGVATSQHENATGYHDNYWFKTSVVETAARTAGLTGEIRWLGHERDGESASYPFSIMSVIK